MRTRNSLAGLAILTLGLQVPVLSFSGSINAWKGDESAHFAIYTSGQNIGGERAILTRLETARQFFEKTGFSTGTPQLSILALDSNQQSEIYRVNPAAYAFYQRTHEGDFVVMRDLEPANFSVAIHEYTHFVVEHAGLKLPLWLNEGVADFYSTVEGRQVQVLLGAAPSGRERILSSHRWIDWNTLTAVDHDSPYYREADKMLLFYAQSWALVHMLALDPQYADGFNKFLQTVSNGSSTDAALNAIYHKSLAQVGEELQSYVGSKRMSAHLLNINIDVRPDFLETTAISDAPKRVELAMAQILAACPQLTQEGSLRLASLATKYPDDPQPEESLGYQAMNAGRMKDAMEHFALAVQHHSQNPDVWFRFAHLKLQLEGASDEVVDLLQRAVAAHSDQYGARLELGFAAAKLEKYEVAVEALEGIHNLKPEHAYTVAYTLAYCFVEIEQGSKARMYADQARKMAASSKDLNEVAGLQRYIDQELPVVVASRE